MLQGQVLCGLWAPPQSWHPLCHHVASDTTSQMSTGSALGAHRAEGVAKIQLTGAGACDCGAPRLRGAWAPWVAVVRASSQRCCSSVKKHSGTGPAGLGAAATHACVQPLRRVHAHCAAGEGQGLQWLAILLKRSHRSAPSLWSPGVTQYCLPASRQPGKLRPARLESPGSVSQAPLGSTPGVLGCRERG